jgi:hypothetical protein
MPNAGLCKGETASTITIFCYAHLHCNNFQIQVPPLQRLTVTNPFSELVAGTCRRVTTSRSSNARESRPAIQILQNLTISYLKLVNLEENDAILDATIKTRTTATTIQTVLLEPPPSPPSPMILSPWKVNKILMNLAKFLRQQAQTCR